MNPKLKKVDNGTSNKVTEVSVVNIEESNIQPGANKMTTNDVNERSFNRYESPNTQIMCDRQEDEVKNQVEVATVNDGSLSTDNDSK